DLGAHEGGFGPQHTDLQPRSQLFAAKTGHPPMNEGQMPSPWWLTDRHTDRKPFLQARGAVTRAIRAWFEAQGFVEVETGILQTSPGNETHLHAPWTDLPSASGDKSRRYLRTSPEFACKKLLAAGETKIVEFARVFRDRERGPLHLTEFTM